MTQTAIALVSESGLSESELIARVLADDRVAARELYDAHAPRVYALAFRMAGDADIARECTQDVFVRAFKTLSKFRGDSKLSTWLYRITVSVVTDATRKIRRIRERETHLDDWQGLDVPVPGIDPHLRERLHRAIDALPEIYRVTVIMHDLEGYTHQEIADALGVAEGTCKSRLFLARAQLRAALADVAEE